VPAHVAKKLSIFSESEDPQTFVIISSERNLSAKTGVWQLLAVPGAASCAMKQRWPGLL